MDAGILRAVVVAVLVVVSAGARYPTPNFIIITQDARLAERLGKVAERCRRDLAIAWLGKAMPDWSHPCPVTVRVGRHLGAGGETTFVFDRGEVFGWRMSIQGSPERLVDSVLPHEMTHMVFASHFRQPLPRWADEGAASTVEHPSERMKHRRMLVYYLKNGGGIPFSQMFAMRNYPRNIMLLYAQGHSLADYLIQKGGRRKYVEFLGEGLRTGQWSAALRNHYGIGGLGPLQNTWLAWVKRGSPPLGRPETAPAEVVAASDRRDRPEPNLVYHESTSPAVPAADPAILPSLDPGSASPAGANPRWQPPDRHDGPQPVAAAAPSPVSPDGWRPINPRPSPPGGDSRPVPATWPATGPVRTLSAHPQPFEQPRQIVLEWGRP